MTAGSLATVVAAPQRFTPRGVPTLIVVVAGMLSLGACTSSGSSDAGPEAEAAAPPTTEAPASETTEPPRHDDDHDRRADHHGGADHHRSADHDDHAGRRHRRCRPGPTTSSRSPRLEAPLNAVGSRSGGETARVQQRLLELGFWLTGPDGSYGLTTRQAVMAFQKYVGLPASGEVDGETAAWLSGMTEQGRATADAGTLVEIDKQRQLLFFVVDGYTQWIFNTSTGNGQEYEEPDQNTPGRVDQGRVDHARRPAQGQPRARRGLVGGRPR